MADGRARWEYRGRTRAEVGVKYVEILFPLNAPSPFFFFFFVSAAVCFSEICHLKISERRRDLWSLSLPCHHMVALKLHTWLSLRRAELLSLQLTAAFFFQSSERDVLSEHFVNTSVRNWHPLSPLMSPCLTHGSDECESDCRWCHGIINEWKNSFFFFFFF